jgi:hypothetical protein
LGACQLTHSVDTASLSTPSIFGGSAFEIASSIDRDMPTHDGVHYKSSVEGKRAEGGEIATDLQDASNVQVVDVSRGNTAVSNAEPTPVGISYNNGFGDFYFGHPESWEKPTITEYMSEEEKLDLMGITGSYGIPVVELNNFKRYVYALILTGVLGCQADRVLRSGPFPYNKLPFEIRERIIRILLRPIFSTYYNGSEEIEYARFELTPLKDPFDELNYGDEYLYAYSEDAARREMGLNVLPRSR